MKKAFNILILVPLMFTFSTFGKPATKMFDDEGNQSTIVDYVAENGGGVAKTDGVATNLTVHDDFIVGEESQGATAIYTRIKPTGADFMQPLRAYGGLTINDIDVLNETESDAKYTTANDVLTQIAISGILKEDGIAENLTVDGTLSVATIDEDDNATSHLLVTSTGIIADVPTTSSEPIEAPSFVFSDGSSITVTNGVFYFNN